MVLAESLVIMHLVLLVTLGGSKESKMIIGAASFNERECEGNPETSKEFMGKCTAWDSSSTESSDLYSTDSPGNCATKAVLIIVQVVSLSEAKMRRSESQAVFLKLDCKSGYTLDTSSSMLYAKAPIFSGS